MFLAIYISTVWRKRKENLRIGVLKNLLIRKVNEHIEIRKYILKKTLEEMYGQYSARLSYEELIKF